MQGDLTKYDWLHLHHEDFTGQFNKFYLGYRDAPWFIEHACSDERSRRREALGFANVPALKKDVAERIRQFVERGGFLFAMCGATETLELAIAGAGRRHRRQSSPTARRRTRMPTRSMRVEAHVRVHGRAPRARRRS